LAVLAVKPAKADLGCDRVEGREILDTFDRDLSGGRQPKQSDLKNPMMK